MRVKYFLQEFMIDSQNKMGNFKVIEGEISSYFRDFKEIYSKIDETSTDTPERKSADAAMVPAKLELKNDRGSWEVGQKNSATERVRKADLS